MTLLALEVTDGSYPLAVLTVHNLLKNLTMNGQWTVQLENNGNSELRILCCCVPPYSHDDTFFE